MRKKRLLLISMMAFATLSLFFVTDVFAECVDPECFQAGDCEISVVRGPNGENPIIVDALSPAGLFYDEIRTACNNYPDGDPIGLPCTAFVYEEPTGCSFSQIAQAIPDPAKYCPDDQWDIIHKSIPSTWQDAGDGDTDTGLYNGDTSTRVLESQPNATRWFIITTTNVSAHPAPVWLKLGKKLYFGTLECPNCWVPPPPVDVSAVSTSTPEGFTLSLQKNPDGSITPTATDPDGNSVPVQVFEIPDILLGTPTTSMTPWEYPDGSGNYYDLEPFKFINEEAFGRVGEDSKCWYKWNGKWYSYSC